MTFDDVLQQMAAMHQAENCPLPSSSQAMLDLSGKMRDLAEQMLQGAKDRVMKDTLLDIASCAVLAILAIGGNDDRPQTH